jgi:glycosyltransferase involved in cell wall biosynthesis
MKSVSIIIPCRNEENYIGPCLESLLANDYPKSAMEIVVVDGMSTDQTREIVNDYCKKHAFIKMIDNPWHIKPKALNIGIQSTASDVVMRIDAHADYADNYISKLIEGLFKHNADNIGGVRETFPGNTALSRAISIGISHPFAVGNAHWRTGTKSVRKVDTVFCGCYKRDVFEKIGLFNEKLIRTQDKEFNTRLLNADGIIICDPSVRCTYYPRAKLLKYLKWNYTGAKWLFYARRFTETKMTTWKNYVPMAFLIYSISLLMMYLVTTSGGFFKMAFTIPFLCYLALALYFSAKIAFKNRRFPDLFFSFLIFPATHFSYGLGSLLGFAKATILGKDIDQ